jgi:hypothetical protein
VKYKTVTVREGEYLGPVDWNYDFHQHAWDHKAGRGGINPETVTRGVNLLLQLTDGRRWQATTDGGIPRCGYGAVLEVGMYDGWPYWKPVPSVLINGFLGASWHPCWALTDIILMEE